MKLLSAIPVLILWILSGTSLTAQEKGCNLKKSFPARKGVKLAVSNKYGDINIVTSKTDSMLICATINIDQDDNNLASESLGLIDFNLTSNNDSVSVATAYNKDFFTPRYSKGRKGFSVDYTIQVPVYTNLYLNNAFGNITVEDCSGYVNTRLSQGLLIMKNLSRGNIKPINTVNVFHTDVEISRADWLSVSIRNCQSVKIGDVQALLMGSEFSKINIDRVHSLVVSSKSDHYDIGNIENLQSESTYSSFNIASLGWLMSSSSVFGSINVSHLNKNFSNVQITANHTPVSITTEKGISFRTDISVSNNMVEFAFDNEPGIKKTRNNTITTITGVAGSNKQTNSLIRITSVLGKLIIQ